MMSRRLKSVFCTKCTLGPKPCPTLWQLVHGGSRCRCSSCDGTTESHVGVRDDEIESKSAISAVGELLKSKLNPQVFNISIHCAN